jgi:hypothetical protein
MAKKKKIKNEEIVEEIIEDEILEEKPEIPDDPEYIQTQEIPKPKKMSKSEGIANCILKLESNVIPVANKLRIVSILAQELGKEKELLLELYKQALTKLSPSFNRVQYTDIEREIEILKNSINED